MAKTDMVSGGSPETGRVGKGSRGISNVRGGVPGGGPDKAPSSSGYPGYADSTPSESDKTQSAK